MNKWVLGIDTSNYTTSLAAMDCGGALCAEQRRLLTVAMGERGLRQSEAVFSHLQNLPDLFEQLAKPEGYPGAISVSVAPRPQQDSYMPVFTAGLGFARVLASAFRIPLFRVSHQEGHIAAGLWSAGGPLDETFLAVHLSGGTSEILRVTRGRGAYGIELLGGTTDLHAGQFVDRVGVALGLPFPSGPHLERLALDATQDVTLPSHVEGLTFSLSGAESAAQRLIKEGTAPADLARAVERCIAASLEKVLRRTVEQTGLRAILLVGGVGANRFIRQRLVHRLEHPAVAAKLYFAEPRACSDNAIGVARLGVDLWTHEHPSKLE